MRPFLRVSGIVLGAILAGAVVYLGARTNPRVSVPQTPEFAAPVSESSAPKQASARTVPARQSRVQPVPSSPQPVPVATESSRPNLTGTWELYLEREEGEVHAVGRFTLKQDNDGISAKSSHHGNACSVLLEGMQFELFEAIQGIRTRTFVGSLNHSNTEVEGEYEGQAARLVRLPEDFLAREKQELQLRKRRYADGRIVYDAIKRFADRNGGKMPTSLSQLTPEDLADQSLLASSSERRITYNGGDMAQTSRAADLARQFKEQEISTEGLLEHERKLREIWGSDVPISSPVIRIEYDNPSLTLDVSMFGLLSAVEPVARPSEETAAVTDALRDLEFSNLKQLGLACKMFANENTGHLPGGWLTVYPEYLKDVAVLRSPWAIEGAVSYELLFPGQAEQDMERMARQLIQDGLLVVANASNYESDYAGSGALMQSIVPIVISRDNLPADTEYKPARAVLFLDGHVEAVPLSEWDARIAPFAER